MTNQHQRRSKKRRPNFEHRLILLTLLTGLPATVVAAWLLWSNDSSLQTRITVSAVLFVWWFSLAFVVRHKIRFPLQTLANLLAGMREGDFSTRVRGSTREDALGELVIEVNTLADTLREQRLGAMEATSLLRTVMSEIEVAVFTFDQSQRLCLTNRAGERLLSRASEQLLGRTAEELALADCLKGDSVRTLQTTFPGGIGRWGMRRTSFRQGGVPHQLLVLTDLSRALRDEERQAWQRLVRVLGHELNNSLAPIKSIAGSLETLVQRDPKPGDWEEDMNRGLAIISARAESLTRFMEAYSTLARLPPPNRRALVIADWVRRVADLETRARVSVNEGPPVTIQGDPDQLDQLLINLVRNAADASLEAGNSAVVLSWKKNGAFVEVAVIDRGLGLSNTSNLFVPFFTTKQNGTGIGLVLCRQIAEAHGGSVALQNRAEGPGCEARVRLPL